MKNVWHVKYEGVRYPIRTIIGMLLCKAGFHSWEYVEVETARMLNPDIPYLTGYEAAKRRFHYWVCQRDFCSAEYNMIKEYKIKRQIETLAGIEELLSEGTVPAPGDYDGSR